MVHLIIAAPEKSALKGLLGALHPGVVHFPIALLAVAALLEVLQVLRKKPEANPATAVLTYLAAASAVPASFFGFMLADGDESSLVQLHQWLGVATTVVSLAAAGFAFKAKSGRGMLAGMRVSIILGSVLVLSTGYIGGELVFGKDHLWRYVRMLLGMAEPVKETSHKPSDPPAKTDGKGPLQIPGKVSFEKEIAPIIKDMCFKCHGGEKIKGKLELNTKALAMKGGQGGKFINPGKPTISSFYSSLIADPESDQYMPPPKEKVRPTKEQIERIKKWIEEGADWPDGFEFKK
jgi:uncharacterized membrane protein